MSNRGTLNPENLKSSLHGLERSASRLAQLTEDLLDVARLQSGRLPVWPTEVDVCDLVSRTVNRHRTQLLPIHSLDLRLPAERCTLMADPSRIEQIVTKLLENALKYSPAGGTVRVEVRIDAGGCLIEIKDRGNSYNAAPVEWQDQALVDQFGQIDSSVAQAHEITNLNIGLTVAQLLLQRAAYIRNTYAFKLGYEFSLLEPGDLVSLTEPHLGLNQFPVRIRTIDEAEDGLLSIVAEEFPGAIGTSP